VAAAAAAAAARGGRRRGSQRRRRTPQAGRRVRARAAPRGSGECRVRVGGV